MTDCPVVTHYLADELVEGKENVIPMTCDSDNNEQACAHYYSAIHEGGIKATYTCVESHKGRVKGDATREWTKQHTNREWWAYTKQHIMDDKGRVDPPQCQADEFPGAYFLDTAKTLPQLIRWLPRFDNAGGGRTWEGFCAKHDGNRGNALRVKPKKDQKYDSLEVLPHDPAASD